MPILHRPGYDPHGFSPKAFEHLLFPLHGSVYQGLRGEFSRLSRECSAEMQTMAALGRSMADSASNEPLHIDSNMPAIKLPKFDIHIELIAASRRSARKSENYRTFVAGHEIYGSPITGLNCHLVLKLQIGTEAETYMAPLPYLMNALEGTVTKPGAHQLYRHSLIPKRRPGKPTPTNLEEWFEDAHTYIGITKRSWKKRYVEHWTGQTSVDSQLPRCA